MGGLHVIEREGLILILKHHFHLKMYKHEKNVMLIKRSQHYYVSDCIFVNKPTGPHEVDFVIGNRRD